MLRLGHCGKRPQGPIKYAPVQLIPTIPLGCGSVTARRTPSEKRRLESGSVVGGLLLMRRGILGQFARSFLLLQLNYTYAILAAHGPRNHFLLNALPIASTTSRRPLRVALLVSALRACSVGELKITVVAAVTI